MARRVLLGALALALASGPLPAQDVERARQLRLSGDVTGAIRELEAALHEQPGEAEILGLLGVCLLDAGELERARELEATLPKPPPQDYRVAVFQGRFARSEGRLERAASHLERALALKERPLEALAELVAVRQALGELGPALQAAESLEALQPELGARLAAAVLVAQAERYQRKGPETLALAAEKLRAARQRAPEDRAIAERLFDVLVTLVRIDEAEALARSRYPGPGDAVALHHALGRCRDALQDTAGAEAEFRACLALDPSHVPARLELARAALDDGETEDAAAHLDACAAAAEDLARFHLLLGELALARRDLAAAEGRLRRAVELAPEDEKVLYQLGRVLHLRGKADEAQAVLARLQPVASGER